MNNKGLTFLEVTFAITLLAVALLGLFQMFNTAINANYRATRELIATHLASSMLAEIMMKDFVDPDDPTNTNLGINTDENALDRSTFDDIDDYDGYSDNPPVNIAGQSMDGSSGTADYSDFTRSVNVYYCYVVDNPDPQPDDVVDDTNNPPTPTNLKHIVVTVTAPLCSMVAEEVVRKPEE